MLEVDDLLVEICESLDPGPHFVNVTGFMFGEEGGEFLKLVVQIGIVEVDDVGLRDDVEQIVPVFLGILSQIEDQSGFVTHFLVVFEVVHQTVAVQVVELDLFRTLHPNHVGLLHVLSVYLLPLKPSFLHCSSY